MQYLNDLFDTVTSLPVDAIIGGVFLALMLTSPVGLAYAVGRRRSKDVSMTLVALATATNLVGMALAIVQAQHVNDSPNEKWARTSINPGTLPPQKQRQAPGRSSGPPDRPRLSDIVAEKIMPDIFSHGDTDHDGRLSTVEAAAVATAFIESSSPRDASICEEDLRRAIADAIESRIRSFFRHPPPPGRDFGQPPGPATSGVSGVEENKKES
jgi:hypothetical protein